MHAILEKINFIPFQPIPFFQTGHAQTLLSQFLSYASLIQEVQKHCVKLSDGDNIILVENNTHLKALHSMHSNRIILLVHGLTGSQDSSYMQRAASSLTEAGFRVFRMNLRGCGEGATHAKKLYHSGRSQDVQEVITWLTMQHPTSSISLIGFSLGANIVLKLAGELGSKLYNAPKLDSVIAVSPPLNLETSVKLLLHKKNKLFNTYFVKRLITHIKSKKNLLGNLPANFEKTITTVFDFDQQITAPLNGFKDAKDYYQQASSGPYVQSITLPTLLLHSLDDPFIGNAEFYQLPIKKNLDLLLTKNGGHVSWLGKTDRHFNLRWMDRLILKWITWIENTKG